MLFQNSVLETQISYFLADGKWRAASEKIKLRIFCDDNDFEKECWNDLL